MANDRRGRRQRVLSLHQTLLMLADVAACQMRPLKAEMRLLSADVGCRSK
jgi:hypothetical protein